MKKFKIKLKRKHPKGKMFFQKHLITKEEKIFEFSKDDIERLDAPKAKNWFSVEEVKEEKKNTGKKPSKSKASEQARNKKK